MIKETVKIRNLNSPNRMKVAASRVGIAPPTMADAGMDVLQQSMKEHGLRTPLLVDTDGNIIDGVRRLVVAQTLGWTEVDVVTADTYDNACAHIKLARETEPHTMSPITVQRTHWFIRDLETLELARTRERLDSMAGRVRATPYKHMYNHAGPVRLVLADALGLPSGNFVQGIKHLYKVTQKPGPFQGLAIELWAKLMSGELSVHAAYGRYRRVVQKAEKINGAADQRRAFTGMVPVVDALISSLQGIGDVNPDITDKEANVWATKLRELRKTIWITYTKLEKKPTKTDKGE